MIKTQLFLSTDYSLVRKRQMATTGDVNRKYLTDREVTSGFSYLWTQVWWPVPIRMTDGCNLLFHAWGYSIGHNDLLLIHQHQYSSALLLRAPVTAFFWFCTSYPAKVPTPSQLRSYPSISLWSTCSALGHRVLCSSLPPLLKDPSVSTALCLRLLSSHLFNRHYRWLLYGK